MTEASQTSTNAAALGEDEMRACVARVLGSQVFANSPRLQDFLSYVTEECLKDRGDQLSAKSIGYHLYGRDAADDANSANFVRVEARRLRRFLDDYYDGDGASDPVRVHIDKGGYAPRFTRLATTVDPVADGTEPSGAAIHPPDRRIWVAAPVVIAVIVVIVVAVLCALIVFGPQTREDRNASKARIEREAIMETSPAALEAANLALQARGLIYPIFDAQRQRLTTELFRAAIEVDPHSAAAHAGAAQPLGSLALLSMDGAHHDALLAEARAMRDRALELDPGDEWVQSAAGWVAFVERDFEEALRYSERALSLAPENGNVLDFYGVVAIASGAFQKGLDAGDRDRLRTGKNTRFAYLNILGAAHFHLGQYDAAVRAFEDGNADGGPVSALGVVYLAASYSALGRMADAERLVEQITRNWPGFPIDAFLVRLHRSPASARQVVDLLEAAGWGKSTED